MAHQGHLNLLKQGPGVWNRWRGENLEVQPDLEEANLSGANLRGANLSGARLSGANLSNASLRYANLQDAHLMFANLMFADLRDTHLREADLVKADLRDASLREADLGKANLGGAILNRANLVGATLRGAKLNEANLGEADLTRADLTGADLSLAILVKTNLSQTTLTNCWVYGIAAWDVNLVEADQASLIITDPKADGAIITVDDLEVAQFIYLLLNHKNLRNMLNAVTTKGVLLLGRFGGGGLEVLQAVAAKLREINYLPIIFDFERPHDRNYTETVKTLAGLSRFIIADLSGPSVPQELYATIPHFKIPFVPILETGRKPFSMAVDLLEYPWVIRPPVSFASKEELLSLIPSKIIAPAEEKYRARQQLLDELFYSS